MEMEKSALTTTNEVGMECWFCWFCWIVIKSRRIKPHQMTSSLSEPYHRAYQQFSLFSLLDSVNCKLKGVGEDQRS